MQFCLLSFPHFKPVILAVVSLSLASSTPKVEKSVLEVLFFEDLTRKDEVRGMKRVREAATAAAGESANAQGRKQIN